MYSDMAVTLYHRTDRAAAEVILRKGFRDNTNYYMTAHLHTGVWLSNVPLDENEGAHGDYLLRVSLDISESELARYEWIEEGKGYREFLIPAELVNGHCKVEIEDICTEPGWV
jgi:hypothetical protein